MQEWCEDAILDPHVAAWSVESNLYHSQVPFRTQSQLAHDVHAMLQSQANATAIHVTDNDDSAEQASVPAGAVTIEEDFSQAAVPAGNVPKRPEQCSVWYGGLSFGV